MSCVISFDFRRLEFHSVRTDTTHPPAKPVPPPFIKGGLIAKLKFIFGEKKLIFSDTITPGVCRDGTLFRIM